MPLDFDEAVGQDDASKDNFCEVQKDQVTKHIIQAVLYLVSITLQTAYI